MFIHVENQKLLWDIITNTEIYKLSFEKSSQVYRDNWFKSIIQDFYKENYLRNLSANALNNLNRDVIAYMVQKMKIMVESTNSMKRAVSPKVEVEGERLNSVDMRSTVVGSRPTNVIRDAPSSTIGSLQSTMQQIEPVSAYSRNQPQSVENKQEAYNRQFSERQKAYDSMLTKPLPPVDVNFGKNVKDEAISNMDELIKQHTRQREEELKQYAPLPSSQNPNPLERAGFPKVAVVGELPAVMNSVDMRSIVVGSRRSLLISQENIKLLPDNVLQEENDSKMKKNVSWSENLENNEIFKTQQNDIDLLKSQVLELTKIISIMKDEFDKMKRAEFPKVVGELPSVMNIGFHSDDTVFSIIEGIIGTIEENTDLVK